MIESKKHLFQLIAPIFLFRLLNAFLCRTFFQPDEYYQSLEIAHTIVYGYGHQTWEWSPSSDRSTGGIRSPLHPFLFVPVYGFLSLTGLDRTQLLIYLPKLVQAAIATLTDLATYSLATVILTPSYGPAALACSLTSFFNAYAGIRTLSNSLEAALTATALVYWPWNLRGSLDSWSQLAISISLIALSIIIRPSSILFWSALTIKLLINSSGEARIDVMALFAVIGIVSSLVCLLIDSSFYGLPTFTPWNFVRQNVFDGLSTFYGINRWHFYFTQAFTFVNFSLFPTVILGMILLSSPRCLHESYPQLDRLRSARFAVLATIVGLSFIQHKEFRFLQPLVPLFNCFAARAMVNNYIKYRETHPATNPADVKYLERLILSRPTGFILRSLLALGAAFYFIQSHYRAQVSVMEYLRRLPDHHLKSVGFLMPCHSTPWQSHLHKPHLAPNGTQERLWMLTCEPPLSYWRNDSFSGASNVANSTVETQNDTLLDTDSTAVRNDTGTKQGIHPTLPYQDEADRFYANPSGFLSTRFPKSVDPTFPATDKSDESYQWPSQLVMFEVLWKTDDEVRKILESLGYRIVWSSFNSRWHDDPTRRAGSVMVLEPKL